MVLAGVRKLLSADDQQQQRPAAYLVSSDDARGSVRETAYPLEMADTTMGQAMDHEALRPPYIHVCW